MNMRDLIRLVEAAAKRYFHGSNAELDPGTILRPTGEPTPHHRREWLLERFRPKDKLSRLSCIYMVDDPSDAEKAVGLRLAYVYRVQPGHIIERSNLHWFNLLSDIEGVDEDDLEWIGVYTKFDHLAEYAANYWAGAPGNDIWEYRTDSAKIIEPLDF